MNKRIAWLKANKRVIGIAAVGTGLAAFLLLIHLGNLVHGISAAEASYQAQYANLGVIAHHPVGLPLLLLHWLGGLVLPLTAFWLRFSSVVFAGVALLTASYVLRRWYGARTALFGFALFVCSAWLLHVGRSATPDVMYFALLPIVYFSNILLHQHSTSRIVAYIWLALQLTLLYVPGGIWFVLLNAFLQREDLKESLASFRSWIGKASLAAETLLLLAPAIFGLLAGSAKIVGLGLLGFPTTMPSLSDIGRQAADSALFVVVRSNTSDALWLNHLPLLDAFMVIATIAGVYFYAKHWRASRSRLLLGSLVIGFALAVLNGVQLVGIVVPVIILIAAAGIAYLLHLWLSVFPRNPLARGVGIGLLSVAVAISCLYGVRQYFVAWPRHQETKQAFRTYKITRTHL